MSGLTRTLRARLLTLPVFALSLLPLASAHAAGAPALPVGGRVQAGQATIGASTPAGLTITQSSSKAIINWQGFLIGQGGKVQFNNGSGATLNRVTGTSLSSIDGLLSGTGSVYLINPNGVIVGKSGVVNVGGTFVASTQDVSNPSFLAGGDLSFTGASSAAVVNYGKIGSLGGDVALIAARVENDGTLSARNGSAGLAAGYSVMLRDAALDEGRFSVLVGGAGTSVTNTGLIASADAELRAEGGNVYALAGDTAGVIRATGVKSGGGKVWLVADGGTLDLAGTIDAEGPGGAPGAVETSGQTVSIQAPRIDAHGGTWLVDPEDLTIDQAAATAIDMALNAGTSVAEQTTATGVSGVGTANTNGNGDIILTAPLTWSTSAGLTLSAYRNVDVNATITSSGAGAVTLRADNTGTGTGTVALGAGGHVSTGGVLDLYYNPAGDNAAMVNTTSYTMPTNYAPFFTGGASATGALNSYMLVNTVYDLQNVRNNLNGTYALGRDIDASVTAGWNGGAGFAPIGNDASMFSGVFNGGGHMVSGLSIQAANLTSVGLFAGNQGLIENLMLSGGGVNAVTGPSGELFVGSLVGNNVGTITNVSSSASISAPTTINGGVGGLVGDNIGTITAASATGAVLGGEGYAGGLIGVNGGLIASSYASGSVTADGAAGGAVGDAGGLVGSNDGRLTNVYATGAVAAGVAGGLAAYSGGGSITNAYATGRVTGVFAGGLVYEAGSITNGYYDQGTTGQVVGVGASFDSQTGVTAVGGNTGLSPYATATYAGFSFGTLGSGANWVSVDTDSSLNNSSGAVGTRPLLMSEYSTTITNPHQLQLAALNPFATYTLANNLDLSAVTQPSDVWNPATGFNPIGSFYYGFYGSFDGQDHTIANLTSLHPNTNTVGLFGSNNGVIKNVNLTNVDVLGYAEVGAVAGYSPSSSSLSNVSVSGTIEGVQEVGAIAGAGELGSTSKFSSSSPPTLTLTNGSASATVIGLTPPNYHASDVGGLVGYGLVTQSRFSGSVQALDGAVALGGLVGYGAASYSTVSGSVTVGANAFAVGGAVGLSSAGSSGISLGQLGIIQNVTSSATVTTAVNGVRVGGLIGDLEPVPTTALSSNGAVQVAYLTQVINSSASGAVTVGAQSTDVGGLIGLVQVSPPVEPAGGTSPGYDPIVVQSVSATGAVSAAGGSSNLGGLIGLQGPNTLTEFAYAGGAVSDGAGSQNTGGLIGELAAGTYVFGFSRREEALYSVAPAGVTNSYSTGAITGDVNVGGLVGQVTDTVITAQSDNGPFPFSSQGEVTVSYASGKVTGNTNPGGLVGYGGATAPALESDYYDVATTGQAAAIAGGGGGAVAIGGMTGLSAYAQSTYASFDFSSSGPWVIFEGDTRPILKTEASSTATNAHQLQLIALDLSGSFTLASDIDLIGTQNPADVWNPATGFVPIGDGSAMFTGSLEGGSHTVSGLFINRPTQDPVGLFGAIGASGVVDGVVLSNVQVTGGNHTGALAGFSKGSVNFDSATGVVSGAIYTGGLLGSNEVGAQLTNSAAIGSTSGSSYVGGLVGINLGRIDNSNTYDATTGSGTYIGGLTGYNAGSVSYAYSQQPVSGQFATGGLVGYNTGVVTNVTAYQGAATAGSNHVGGLVGFNDGMIEFAAAENTASGSSFVGGLAGSNETTGVIENSGNVGGRVAGGDEVGGLTGYNAGVINSSNDNAPVTATGSQAGGLVGMNLGYIVNAYSQAPVTGSTNVGGLVGYNQGLVQTDYSISSVTGSDHVGGLVGRNQGSITTSAAYGSVTGETIVGGLAGSNEAGAVINQASSGVGSPNSFDVGYGEILTPTGAHDVGGLVGINLGAISNAFATTPAIGQSFVGGLVGVNGAGGSLSLAYAAGPVSGQSATGGVAGSNAGSVSDVYFDTSSNATNQTTEFGVNTSAAASTNAAIGGVTGRSAEEAGSYPGFDFTGIWRAPTFNDVGFSYPTLKNVPVPY